MTIRIETGWDCSVEMCGGCGDVSEKPDPLSDGLRVCLFGRQLAIGLGPVQNETVSVSKTCRTAGDQRYLDEYGAVARESLGKVFGRNRG